MTIERPPGEKWDVVRCDAKKCLPKGQSRMQTLKMDPEDRQSFLDAIGWLTKRVMVRGDAYEERHLCPFCAAREGHPENLQKLGAIFFGRNKKAKIGAS